MESDDIKYQQMQDEMSRFEAEIAGEQKSRPVIAASTYGSVQQKLQGGTVSGPLLPTPSSSFSSDYLPPPPPPPSLLLPTQLQRARLPPPPSFPNFPTFLPSLSPPKPQPVVLSSAPQLYKTKDKKNRDSGSLSPNLYDAYYKETEPQFTPSILQMPLVTPTPEPPPHPIISSTPSVSHKISKKEKKNRKVIRTAGGQVWEDMSLLDWPDDDFRLFCGDLGNDVTDELLTRTFSKYSSFYKAKVIRDKRTNKSKGFGFISFKEPADFIKAMKEMNGRYVGSRPIKLRKSTWKARALDAVRKKEKEKAALIALLTGNPSKS